MRSLIVLAALGRLATAQPRDALDEARALELSLDYERALVIVDREIDRGAAGTVPRLVQLHLLAGRLAAGIDHPDVAEAHFAIALALAPSLQLPDGTSPKLTQPFDAARARSVPFAIELERDGRVIAAKLGDDPAHVFGGIRVALVPVSGERAELVAFAPAITVPPDRVAAYAIAIDEHGNAISESKTFAAPPAPVPVPVPLAPARVDVTTPIYARWTTWAIATAGALAVAGACAWRFEVAQDDWNQLEAAGGHDYTQLADIESRGRTWGIAADVGFGVAAAAGVAAIVVLVAHRDPDARAISHGDVVGLSLAF
ncbi:MAG TPA: hypothetical protein VH143_16905 [Kofleriaceae bacterium]|nr:hypothetical protein [Kofleriaceae bacterium]